MRHIVCGLSDCTKFLKHFLKSGTIFEKQLLNTNVSFDFLYNFLSCFAIFLPYLQILRSAHTAVFMCFVWISEQTAIISLYSIN